MTAQASQGRSYSATQGRSTTPSSTPVTASSSIICRLAVTTDARR